jgi:hypothetical protein
MCGGESSGVGALHLTEQPRARVSPVALGGWLGKAEDFSGFVGRQPCEIFQLHQFRLLRVVGGELFQRVVNGEQFIFIAGRGDRQILQRHVLLATAMSHGPPPPRVVDEDAPHRFRGSREKMRAVGPRGTVIADESEIRLMHQRGGLQSVARKLIRHLCSRELAQFLINDRKQLRGGGRIFRRQLIQDACEVVHLRVRQRGWSAALCSMAMLLLLFAGRGSTGLLLQHNLSGKEVIVLDVVANEALQRLRVRRENDFVFLPIVAMCGIDDDNVRK